MLQKGDLLDWATWDGIISLTMAVCALEKLRTTYEAGCLSSLNLVLKTGRFLESCWPSSVLGLKQLESDVREGQLT